MRFWWLAVVGWLVALFTWFNELAVLVLARVETDYADWKLLLLLFIWIFIVFSYFHAVFTPPAAIPTKFREEPAEGEVNEAKFCDKCQMWKPERAHHCRVCNSCILRMDHHCPILQMCVHHGNHKFYLLYLIWPGLLGLYAVYLCAPCVYRTLLQNWDGSLPISVERQFIVSAAVNAVTIIAAVVYLLRIQLPNLLHNRTIIEEARIAGAADGANLADYEQRNWKENVAAVMGPMWSWLLPIDTVPGDGIAYEFVTRQASQMK